MTRQVSRSGRRNKTVQYYNDDGLMELGLGIGLLLAGLTATPDGPLAVVWLMLAVVAIVLAKKVITAPRLKDGEIDPATVQRAAADTAYSTTRAAIKAVTLVAVATVFVLHELLARSQEGRSSDIREQPVFLTVAIVGACFGAGYQYKASRLYAYGSLATVLIVISIFSDLSLKFITSFTGLVMVLAGGFYLFRFLNSHQRSTGDV